MLWISKKNTLVIFFFYEYTLREDFFKIRFCLCHLMINLPQDFAYFKIFIDAYFSPLTIPFDHQKKCI